MKSVKQNGAVHDKDNMLIIQYWSVDHLGPAHRDTAIHLMTLNCWRKKLACQLYVTMAIFRSTMGYYHLSFFS